MNRPSNLKHWQRKRKREKNKEREEGKRAKEKDKKTKERKEENIKKFVFSEKERKPPFGQKNKNRLT